MKGGGEAAARRVPLRQHGAGARPPAGCRSLEAAASSPAGSGTRPGAAGLSRLAVAEGGMPGAGAEGERQPPAAAPAQREAGGRRAAVGEGRGRLPGVGPLPLGRAGPKP